jgi:hypothetical protein
LPDWIAIISVNILRPAWLVFALFLLYDVANTASDSLGGQLG